MMCNKCNVQMIYGIAIKPNEEANSRYIVQPPLINNKTLKLIKCLKCPICGHSDDDLSKYWLT